MLADPFIAKGLSTDEREILLGGCPPERNRRYSPPKLDCASVANVTTARDPSTVLEYSLAEEFLEKKSNFRNNRFYN